MLSFSTLMLIGFLSSTAISYSEIKGKLLADIEGTLAAQGDVISRELSGWLNRSLNTVKAFAKTLSDSPQPLRNNPTFEFYLQQEAHTKDINYLAYALEEDGYYTVNDWTIPPDFDPRTRPWYLPIKHSPIPAITYYQGITPPHKPYLAATAPIFRGDQFAGVVSADISFNAIENYFHSLEISLGGHVLLINNQNHILFHSKPTTEGRSASALSLVGKKLQHSEAFKDLPNHEALNQLPEQQLHETSSNFYWLTRLPESSTMLLLVTPKAEVNHRIITGTLTLTASFLAIFILVMAALYFYNRRIISPLIDNLELDNVTNLPNKKTFKNQVTENFLSKNRQGTLVIFSVNQFKGLTAAYSNHSINNLLNQIKQRLQSCFSQQAITGIFSESRFIAYLPYDKFHNRNSQQQWLTTIYDELSQPYDIYDQLINCSFIIGVCEFPKHGNDIEELIDNVFTVIAHQQSKDALNTGFYSPDIKGHVGNKVILLNAITNALSRKEFSLAYQPQYDSETQQLVGLEALIRWHSSEFKRWVSPVEFIPAAEQSKLIVSLGSWVIESAAQQIQHWKQEGFNFGTVSINISPRQLLSPGFIEQLTQTLSNYGVQPHEIELEITETLVLKDPQQSIALLDQLKALGFSIAIDDFGTGYSSLEYLKLIPADKLKIDRAFIRDLEDNETSQAIVQLIVAMADTLNCSVLAEGVETEGQLYCLQRRGCKLLQGYLYAKPMSADEVTRYRHHDENLSISNSPMF